MHISFIDASILCIDDGRIAPQILCLRARSEALLTSLADQATLHAQTKTVFALVLLEAL